MRCASPRSDMHPCPPGARWTQASRLHTDRCAHGGPGTAAVRTAAAPAARAARDDAPQISRTPAAWSAARGRAAADVTVAIVLTAVAVARLHALAGQLPSGVDPG